MIFEGMEIDYAHVKLVPIYEVLTKSLREPELQADYFESYPGYVSSVPGPLGDQTDLSEAAHSNSENMTRAR